MGKVSKRDKIVLLTICVAGFIYTFYTYVNAPLIEKKKSAETEIRNLTTTASEAQYAILQQKYEEVVLEEQSFQKQIDEIKKEKSLGEIKYEDLITFLGEEANNYKVDITKLDKKELSNTNSYWEMEYEMKVEGDYKDLVGFINSMYGYNKYFVIKGIDIHEVAAIPMTEKVEDGQEGLRENIPYSWFLDFTSKLDETLPSELLSSDEEDGSEEKLKDYEKKLQIYILFSFISLEEPTDY